MSGSCQVRRRVCKCTSWWSVSGMRATDCDPLYPSRAIWWCTASSSSGVFFFFQAEDGIRDYKVTGVQTCALPIFRRSLGFYAGLALNLLSPLPYAVAKYRSRALGREISARAASGGVDIVVCDFLDRKSVV